MWLVLTAPLVYAQDGPKRLSDWLLERTLAPDDYPLGLSWRVPGERVSQAERRLGLLKSLSGLDPEVKADPEVLRRLRDWVGALPVTGRARVSVPDARWLQANPARDPILQAGDSVVLPKRPRTVTVVTARGGRCAVTHSAGLEAVAYVKACSPSSSWRVDWAWVAQPDGRVQRFGIAAWNQETQDEPAPGAWIWAPPRDGGWPEKVSQRLIEFLATQGPAPDPARGSAIAAGKTESIVGETPRGGTSESWAFSRSPFFANKLEDQRTQSGRSGIAEDSPLESDRRGAVVVAPPQQSISARSRSLEVTASDWGGVGLLQTPTARMHRAGHFSFNFSRESPYSQGNVMLQPFDWLEAGFRYTDVSNRLSGPPELSGSQSYKDKSVDVKFRLLKESTYVPDVVVGLRDIAGTGLFSGEYFVANKRTGALDWSLGLGWGYVGGRGDLRNPLGRLIPAFDTRKTDVGQGGSFALSSYFRGPTALFGGVQYQTPWERLILKLEYDGNNYQREPRDNNQRQSSPWNFGLVYRYGRAVDFTIGVERGNTLMAGFTLHTQLDGLSTPKLNDPPRVAVAAARPQRPPEWSETAREIKNQTGWHVRSIEQRGRELRVIIEDAQAVYWRERLDRAAAVLHRDAPASVDRFSLTYRQRGLDVAEHAIDRETWVAEKLRPLPPAEQREAVIARAAEKTAPRTPTPDPVLYDQKQPIFESGLGFNFQQTLGGPDSFVLYQVSAVERAKLRIREDTWIDGALRLGLINNYDKFEFTAPSELPRVRTFLREYLTTSRLTMPNLQLTHVGRLSENQHYSVYGGYLEEMFAGVGAEWLYRPFGSRMAFGVDVNAVRQRDFRQDFSLRDYRVATGHATLYWDTGWNDVQATLSAGRYLAKDAGVTVQLSRVFKNGVTLGAFFSRTNVSSEQFGEGSFDKGVFVSIPFDAFLTRSSNTIANFVWKPLTRDGGAKLGRSAELYELTGPRSDRTLRFESAPPPNHATIPADRRDAWSPPPEGPEPYLRVSPKPAAEKWTREETYEHRLTEALYRQEFRNIRVAYDGSNRLSVTASNDRIRPLSRAAGRAARTALRLAPLETREIRITLAGRVDPLVTYDFFDLQRLERYFNGAIGRADLADYVAVAYFDPSARQKDPLERLDDLETDVEATRLVDLLPSTRSFARVRGDFAAAGRTAAGANWLEAGAYGAGLVVGSVALDRRIDRFAADHESNRWVKGVTRAGNALPWLALAGSAVAALDSSDPVRSRTGFAATEAGATAFLVATGLKYAVGRARPGDNASVRDFKPFSTDSGFDAFPSRHTAVMWAVATPFALEYNAPWLYGVAALSNIARVGSREHWFSDTVAGSLIGYGIGRIFWESSRTARKGEPRVLVHPSGVHLAWEVN
ncbi:MAG: YjbH domain-containing protein [Betaproteobacteria bacterium]|nr:YjbH domain-containing protein [Betaproteobacteria bacterium]